MEITKNRILETIYKKDRLLTSTHSRLSLPIIRRIYKKMVNGIRFDDIKVCENFLIDGHHRYVSSILAEVSLDTAGCSKTSATQAYEWSEVDFVEEEWDTKDKIFRLNQLDAEFNDIPLEKIIEITK